MRNTEHSEERNSFVRSAVPEFPPLTIYLDSNVLFSASYDAISPFLKFWKMAGVTPATSLYAVAEVTRHIQIAAHQHRFDELIARTRKVSDADVAFVPQSIRLVAKDRPILAAAIAASVDYLVTGDKNHFSHLYFQRVSHVFVINPADFLDMHEDRLFV
jgi:predicted nucleic acid-binding protein